MENCRNNILNVAEELFQNSGIRKVSIDDICNKLQISKKTFYKIFVNKEELVEMVFMQSLNKHIAKMQKIYQNMNAIDAIVASINEVKKGMDKKPTEFILDLEKYYPKILEDVNKIRVDMLRKKFEQNLLSGIKDGYYRDDLDIELTSILHSGYLSFAFESIYKTYPKINKKRISDFFIDLLVRTITNEKGFEYIKDKTK